MESTIPVRHEGYRPRPASIVITKGVSQPATEGPSFLTVLPAESRNEVYGWLLKRDEPIIYIGSRTADEPDFVSGLSDSEDDQDASELTEEETAILCAPTHDIGPSVALLLTCRQVYHEAVGILYGANDFLIASNLTTHNTYMDQLKTAQRFLHSLGTQLVLLRKITIDISPLCHIDCQHDTEAQGSIDILPLLRLKWFFPSVEVNLTHTSRRIDVRVHYEEETSQSIDVHLLTELAKAIGTLDCLGLKRHGKFDRLIEKVLVSRELKKGKVAYSSACNGMYYRPGGRVVVPFTMKQGPPGRLNSLKWAKRVRTSDLHPLPGHIYDRIIRHAMKSTDEIILDLDHQRAEGLALNLLGVNRGLRQIMRADYADSNRIVVRLRTDEATSTFSDWEHLRSWRGGTLSCIFPTNIDAPTRKDRELVSTIDLNFNIAPPATLADVRVGVTEFIRLTYGLRPHSVLRFILHGKGL